jgi:outer membrane protein assembly factor BamB
MLHVLLLTLAVLTPPAEPSDLPLEHAWSVSLEAWQTGEGIVSVHAVSDLLLVEDSGHRVTAFDRATGEPRWLVALEQGLAQVPGFAMGHITLTTREHVTVVSEASGERLYDQRLSTEMAAAPIAGESLVFEPTYFEGTLFAYGLKSGVLSWRYRIKSGFAGQAVYIPSSKEPRVVVPGTDGWLRAIPATSKVPVKLLWSLDVGLPVGASVTQGDTLFMSTRRNTMIAVDCVSGAYRWTSSLGEMPLGGPVPVGELLLVGTEEDLLALRASDGQVAWRTGSRELPLAAVPGLVICQLASGRIVGRRTADGSRVDVPAGSRVLSTGPFLVDWSDGRHLSVARSTH